MHLSKQIPSPKVFCYKNVIHSIQDWVAEWLRLKQTEKCYFYASFKADSFA